MNQVLFDCEAGHCPNEAGIGSWKSYEEMAVDTREAYMVLV